MLTVFLNGKIILAQSSGCSKFKPVDGLDEKTRGTIAVGVPVRWRIVLFLKSYLDSTL